MARLNGISDSIANTNSLDAYFLRFFVWKYPSTIRNAKMGKEMRPMQVSQSFPGTIVPHKWSQSMNAIAIKCKEKDVVSKNFVCFKLISAPSYSVAILYHTVSVISMANQSKMPR